MSALTLRAVSKRYGTVIACDGVDLDIDPGEIHGLLGENGAGKSTLMRILFGLETRDAGTVLRDGEPVRIAGPQDAAALGLGMVHQHFSLIDPLPVWENIILGDTGRIRRAAARAEILAIARRYGLPIDPLAIVGTLSAGERQRVELIKCLRRDPGVLILDEPTSVLTRAESAELFAVLRRVVRSERRAVVLISHKLAEITAATDRVTVLRRGRVVFRSATRDTDVVELARQMVGRDVSLGAEAAALGLLPTGPGTVPDVARQPAMRLRGLVVRPFLNGVDLDVRPGEITGLYGAEGNGQTVLGDVLSGLVVPDTGIVELGGVPVALKRPGALHRAGLGIVPEDRHRAGVVLDLSVAANLVMKDPVVNRRRLRRTAERLAEEFGIVGASLDAPLRTLSGGNQQRVVLARELSAHTKVLVVAQPSHGLDVGAAEDLYARLRSCARDGVAVLLISTEIEEVLGLTDRIAVIASGRIAGELRTADATTERLGLLVGGVAR
ncbi:ABC transporter ATP-binding protein [Winogradskya consettensis]|uniref:Heme ABC transporter ATP-binding protein n=1 Tax=Winogradskya consettensis TaxID=113560 RepID=A0A919SAD1_9ACTN|nr:ATP-binding cassette domain-containing protein [Actinoplanes consettensis]GIM68121.1 heme ABC transporter ATP-binding protein [Actinoplanes consettensis]